MNKRGRKRKLDYFGPEEEEAVVLFLETEDMEFRNKIYNEWLKEPIEKMVESIIRRYKLYRKGISFEELHADTISYLICKSDRFENSKGKKAYSYYGTICKNYILGLLIKDNKNFGVNTSFEDSVSSLEERPDMIYYLSDTDYLLDDLIRNVSDEIKLELEGGESKKKITDNERRVGEALIEILNNWETIFEEELEKSAKFNKNLILSTIRNYTNLTTKDIRIAMKRFKKLYGLLKNDKIDNGYI